MSSFTKKDLLIIEELAQNQGLLSKKYRTYAENSKDIEVKEMFENASISAMKNVKDLQALL